MARNLDPKCKQCRRAGERLYLKGERCLTPKCAIVKRNYPPGFHGPRGKKRISDYGQQLAEKQKAKRQYNMLEKQFRLLFEKAKARPENTGDIFLQLLEMRLDNAIFRLGFAKSRAQARQIVNHGLITVNDTTVTIPSYQVKTGDKLRIKSNKQKAKLFTNLKDELSNKEIPGWLNFSMDDMTAKVLHRPSIDMIQPNFNTQMIIEYYSR